MKPSHPLIEYPILTTWELERLAAQGCPCCGEKFTEDQRMDLTAKCHTGPVYVSYWGRWLCLDCGGKNDEGEECRKPIGKLPLLPSALKGDK